jgi:hypothetical protein
MATTWITRWQAEIAPTRLPGVWKMKTGGHLVRVRVSDPTGRKVEIRKRLPELDEAQAFAWLEAERLRIRHGDDSAQKRRQSFAAFARSLMEEKVTTREIVSARGREKWKHTLTHLIAGTGSVAGFGDLPIDRVTASHVQAWRLGIARLLRAPGEERKDGTYSPSTINGWIGILKHITLTARKRLKLSGDAAEDLSYFDTSEHPTYSEEEPNTVTALEARRFLAAMKSEFPQHYAMTYLGFATGLRPSQLRPLRRSGSRPDVRWDEHEVLIRRSHTLDSIMERTKTKLRQKISLPGRSARRPSVARRDAAAHGGAAGIGSALPRRGWSAAFGVLPQEAVRDLRTPLRHHEEGHTQGDATHVHGPHAQGEGRELGAQIDLGSPDRRDGGQVLVDRSGRAARRGGDGPARNSRRSQWGRRWGQASREWGRRASEACETGLILCRRDWDRTNDHYRVKAHPTSDALRSPLNRCAQIGPATPPGAHEWGRKWGRDHGVPTTGGAS